MRNSRRRAEFAKASNAADAWVLTETHDALIPNSWSHVVSTAQRPGVGAIAGVTEGSRWVSIWSCHPMSQLTVADPERTAAALVSIGDVELLVYGTVLPWYTDTERNGMAAELASQGPEWVDHSHLRPLRRCVAGDFNVNIGGPHYYGSSESRRLVLDCLSVADLRPVTTFECTRHHYADHGLIDHVALSPDLARDAEVVAVIGRTDQDGQFMSDHHGVIVEFSS